jgi:hypothetical protein
MRSYLECGHCHCEFLPSKRQWKRHRSSKGHGTVYCSKICWDTAGKKNKKEKLKYQGVCPTCQTEFQSSRDKKFCGLKCYVASPQFKAMMHINAEQGRVTRALKATGEPPKKHVEIQCLNCGTCRMVKPSLQKRKFCNSRCYRQYMVGRFDRWIASPQAMSLPQAYDEFLMQEELPCLIEGCTWTGRQLGNHVNFAHGITAEEFKRAAGFNLGTGLITPDVAEILSNRAHIHGHNFYGKRSPHPPIVKNYFSLEAREHKAKATALARFFKPEITRVCVSCGKDYKAKLWRKYCSIQCRSDFYQRNLKSLKFYMVCFKCGKDFQGSVDQNKRRNGGYPVFCSPKCRGKHNSVFAGRFNPKRIANAQEFL